MLPDERIQFADHDAGDHVFIWRTGIDTVRALTARAIREVPADWTPTGRRAGSGKRSACRPMARAPSSASLPSPNGKRVYARLMFRLM